MIELLNELRVALPGVQILFAFLLTVPFTQRFSTLTTLQRDVFFVTLLSTTLATACLIAPSAAHRIRFHKSDRSWLIEAANTLLLAGIALLAVAIGSAFLLISDVLVRGRARVGLLGCGVDGDRGAVVRAAAVAKSHGQVFRFLVGS